MDQEELHRCKALTRAAKDTRQRSRDESAVGRASAGDAPRTPILGQSSPTTPAAGTSSSTHPPACRTAHNRHRTLDKRCRHQTTAPTPTQGIRHIPFSPDPPLTTKKTAKGARTRPGNLILLQRHRHRLAGATRKTQPQEGHPLRQNLDLDRTLPNLYTTAR